MGELRSANNVSHCIQRVPFDLLHASIWERTACLGREHQHIRAHSTYGLVNCWTDGVFFFFVAFSYHPLMAGNNGPRGRGKHEVDKGWIQCSGVDMGDDGGAVYGFAHKYVS
jgi:hypothetical protein